MKQYYGDFQHKFINDSVYGGIGLSAFEVDLINTRIFQRLRRLSQLGYVNYVFPCAEHSRFVHSLGVLYVMGRFTAHLRARGDITEKDEVKLRIAALLHDIGHYPLSHLGEYVYAYKEASGKKLLKKSLPGSLLSKVGEITKDEKKATHHEYLGAYIIANNKELQNIISKVKFDDGTKIDPIEIGQIITGQNGIRNFLYSQLMHSSLDADRLDYLLRDSYQTGVRYGLVDLDYLIRLIRVVNLPIEHDGISTAPVIACNIKGQHVIEHYLMARYFHYSQVIGHKTSLAFEAVAKAMFFKLLMEGKFIFNSYSEILTNINDDKFLKFTDSELSKCLDEHYDNTMDSEFKLFYEHVRFRKRPRTLIEIKAIHDKTDPDYGDRKYYNLKRIITREPECITKLLGINEEHIGYHEISVSVETIPSYLQISDIEDKHMMEESLREAVRLVDQAGHLHYLALDKNSLINKLTDLKSSTIRIFYLEPCSRSLAKKCLLAKSKVEELIRP